MGLREDILGMDDRRSTTVTITDWKKTFTITAFSGAELDAWQDYCGNQMKQHGKVPNMRAKLATLLLVDEKGEPLFTDKDVEVLTKKSGHALDQIFNAWLSLNKFTDEEAAEYEKNS